MCERLFQKIWILRREFRHTKAGFGTLNVNKSRKVNNPLPSCHLVKENQGLGQGSRKIDKREKNPPLRIWRKNVEIYSKGTFVNSTSGQRKSP
jgi:hypothetical protein